MTSWHDTTPPAGRGNRERRCEIAKGTGQCQLCPPHQGHNRRGARRPRPDRGKNKWRG